MASSLHELTASELIPLLRSRKVSPVELVQACLARAEQLQPVLNCFITLCGDRAMEDARAAEASIMRGDARGMLQGIPFTVKDLVNTEGVRTTYGTLFYKDNVPTQDAVGVARMRAAGAILLGKTTTPEFGSQPFTRSPLFGQTRNAWSAERSSGGSSGGAAVATAAGITPLAIATDGGGSTRIPAACNGVVGIKQTTGVIPHSQAQDLYGNQTYVTPTTRSVADTGLMMDVMAGPDPVDPWSLGLAKPDYVAASTHHGDMKGRRVLFSAAPAGRTVSADVAAALDRALGVFSALGASLEAFDNRNFLVEATWRVVNHTVWRARFLPLIEQSPESFSDDFKKQIESAGEYSALQYQQAMFERSALFHRVQGLLANADVLVMPTLSRTALPLDMTLFDPIEIDGAMYEGVRSNFYPWTMLFNMTGHPAISIPCGFGQDGLPIGIHLVARFGEDALLLKCAAMFEQALGMDRRLPEYA